ncbi:MAG: 5'-3' exonuclease H3TH domain-containing protein, partial [Acidobacteriota bacterium]
MVNPVTVHLVDASPYVFRAFHALPDSIRDPEGRPVNAVYGFGSFLVKLVETEAPTHLAVAFDRSLTTSFRNDLYPDYKTGRELPPPDLEAQLDDCMELARAFGAEVFVDERYEADDLIAALVAQLNAAGHGAVIVTSDKDLAQLVTDRVRLFDFAREERLGPEEVVAKLGVRPEQVPDFLALAGDPVDSIPGLPGVGRKTAAALLEVFADLETAYERLFGRTPPGVPIQTVNLRVEVKAPAPGADVRPGTGQGTAAPGAALKGTRPAYFKEAGGFVDTRVYDRYRLAP